MLRAPPCTQFLATLSNWPQAFASFGLSAYTPLVAQVLFDRIPPAFTQLRNHNVVLLRARSYHASPGEASTSITTSLTHPTPTSLRIPAAGASHSKSLYTRAYSSSHRSSPAGFEHMPTVNPSDLPPHIILVRHGEVSAPSATSHPC